MSNSQQLGCRHFGSVLTLTSKVWPNRVEVTPRGAVCREQAGEIKLLCDKCSNPVGEVTITPS
jgi:hypothetical protein